MRRWVPVATVAAVLAAAVAVVLLRSDGGDGGTATDRPPDGTSAVDADAIHVEAPVAVSVAVGTPTAFTWAGAEHEATLLAATDTSAVVAFASETADPVTLSTGAPTAVDLSSDGVADAVVTLDGTGDASADLTLTAPTAATWDESGFTTTGGYRPYRHHNNGADEDFAVVPDAGGGSLLLYVSEDRRLNWERYGADGSQVTTPGLGAGTLEAGTGDGRVTSVDAAALPGGQLAVMTTTSAGTSLRILDATTLAAGPPLHVGRSLANPAVVAGTEPGTVHVVAGGGFDPPQATDGLARVVVSEVTVDADGARVARQVTVTELTAPQADLVADAAVDTASGTLLVSYLHRTTGELRELRVVGVDLGTLEPEWTAVAGTAANRGARPHGALGVDAAGVATLVWRHDSSADGGQRLHVAEVSVDSGAVTRAWDGTTGSGSPRLVAGYPVELVAGGDGLALAHYDSHANPDAPSGSADRGRFVLWGWTGGAWADGPLVLDGGKPILADVLLDLNAFAQTPPRAICGAPVALRGTVVDRGSRDAADVVVTASVDDEVVGTAELGTVAAASSEPFSIVWTVPADLTAAQVEVTYAVTTSSEQYTTGNDVAPRTVDVRQDGLVAGRVVDASNDREHASGWYPGLPGATVRVGDREALTDIAGTFWMDGLGFGTYAVTVERDGYNPLSTEVSVSRTRPLAFVAAELDDHGTVTFQVADEAGQALAGVAVHLHDFRETATTKASGEVGWELSAGSYTFSFTLRGYHPVLPQEVAVALGEDRVVPVTMRAATTALLGGRVIDARGAPVGSATVTITNEAGAVVATPAVSAGGTFEPVELPARPAAGYVVTVSGNGLVLEEAIRLFGGDDLFETYGLVPGRGELRVRTAAEGFTSWMVHAGWPGIGPVGGADIYVWYGNYAIGFGAEYWEGTNELAAVDVEVWGGSYETHATASEVDFSGWFAPPSTGSVFDLTRFADVGGTLVGSGSDLLTIGEGAYDLFAGEDDADEWLETGQGNELLTWREAQSDFAPEPAFDSSDPLGSLWSVTEAVPRDFAIPIVIGGASEQQTAVRVDQVDVVRFVNGAPVEVSGPSGEWFSFQGPEEARDNANGQRYDVVEPGVPYDDVVVYVWLTVQKYSGGAPGGTSFDQRERQVVVFHPGPQSVEGFIASGSLYRDPSRMAG